MHEITRIRLHINELEEELVALRRKVRDLEAWKVTAKGLLEVLVVPADYYTDETDF